MKVTNAKERALNSVVASEEVAAAPEDYDLLNFLDLDYIDISKRGQMLGPSSVNDLGFTLPKSVLDLLNSTVQHTKDNLEDTNQISEPVFWFLVMAYVVLLVTGLLGNILIIWSVLWHESMRTARNVFITTLAISDLILCIFTMPTTLWEMLYEKWPFGPDTEVLCRLANAGRETPVYMSSMSIVAIAIERYCCIIHPDLPQLNVSKSVLISLLMAALSLLLSVPLFVGTKLTEIPYLEFAAEQIFLCRDSRPGIYRKIYSLVGIILQFVLPILVVVGLYLAIYIRLSDRPPSRHTETKRRRQRTNMMILLICITFFLSWLPRNVLYIILEFSPELIYERVGLSVYVACHIFALCPACANPIIYGYLNENFRKVYKNISNSMQSFRFSPRPVAVTIQDASSGTHNTQQYVSSRTHNTAETICFSRSPLPRGNMELARTLLPLLPRSATASPINPRWRPAAPRSAGMNNSSNSHHSKIDDDDIAASASAPPTLRTTPSTPPPSPSSSFSPSPLRRFPGVLALAANEFSERGGDFPGNGEDFPGNGGGYFPGRGGGGVELCTCRREDAVRLLNQGLPHPMFGFERRRFLTKRRALVRLNGCPLAAGRRLPEQVEMKDAVTCNS